MTKYLSKHNNRFVLSPLTTLRFRMGSLYLTSPINYKLVRVTPSELSILLFLTTPKTFEELDYYSNLNDYEVMDFIDSLFRNGILIVVQEQGTFEPRVDVKTGITTSWWDPSDLSYYDIRVHQILQVLYGNSATLLNKSSIDRNGQPIPWFSYPAIEYLDRLNLSDKSIFEYGSGSSTLFFATRCKRIISVEHNESWFKKINESTYNNVSVLYRPNEDEYIGEIKQYNERFDVIVIDGIPSSRYACACLAVDHLAENGFLILDDAAMYKDVANFLTSFGLVQIDMSGIAPLEDYVQTTSFFFHRNIDPIFFRDLNTRAPKGSPGTRWQ